MTATDERGRIAPRRGRSEPVTDRVGSSPRMSWRTSHSIARAPERDALPPASDGLRRGPPPRLVAVLPVVPARRSQVRRERERAARLVVASQERQRAAEAEQGVVVRRRVLDALAELLGRLRVPARAEQGATERFADRGLVGLEVAS